MSRLEKRISVTIYYDSPNRINYIEGNGRNFEEAMLDLLNKLFELEREFKTNNIETGGHTAFLSDVEIVLNNKENYICKYTRRLYRSNSTLQQVKGCNLAYKLPVNRLEIVHCRID